MKAAIAAAEVAIADRRVLEGLLNEAIEEFVRKVVTDPEVTQHVVAGR